MRSGGINDHLDHQSQLPFLLPQKGTAMTKVTQSPCYFSLLEIFSLHTQEPPNRTRMPHSSRAAESSKTIKMECFMMRSHLPCSSAVILLSIRFWLLCAHNVLSMQIQLSLLRHGWTFGLMGSKVLHHHVLAGLVASPHSLFILHNSLIAFYLFLTSFCT